MTKLLEIYQNDDDELYEIGEKLASFGPYTLYCLYDDAGRFYCYTLIFSNYLEHEAEQTENLILTEELRQLIAEKIPKINLKFFTLQALVGQLVNLVYKIDDGNSHLVRVKAVKEDYLTVSPVNVLTFGEILEEIDLPFSYVRQIYFHSQLYDNLEILLKKHE